MPARNSSALTPPMIRGQVPPLPNAGPLARARISESRSHSWLRWRRRWKSRHAAGRVPRVRATHVFVASEVRQLATVWLRFSWLMPLIVGHRWPPMQRRPTRVIPMGRRALYCVGPTCGLGLVSDVFSRSRVCRPSPYHLAMPPQLAEGPRLIAHFRSERQPERVNITLALQAGATEPKT